MAKDLKDIQQLINDKADQKLYDAVQNLHRHVSNGENYQLLKDVLVNVGTSEKPKMLSLAYVFSDSGFRDKIIEINQQRYRSNENSSFIEQVESIRQHVDNLLNVRPNDY